MYAADIALLSASVVHLQKMLKICQLNEEVLDITFNPNKPALLSFGKVFKE